jgi:hypothetical protein
MKIGTLVVLAATIAFPVMASAQGGGGSGGGAGGSSGASGSSAGSTGGITSSPNANQTMPRPDGNGSGTTGTSSAPPGDMTGRAAPIPVRKRPLPRTAQRVGALHRAN